MSSTSPKVTVLMPVYNGGKFLSHSIESILQQTFKDFEFLIVNDGSTDSSAEVVSSYSDDRIRLVSTKRNKGLAYSLNKGIKLARGKYIARMDADDISLPQRLEKQMKFLELHPKVGVCSTWVSFFTKIPGIGGKYCPTGGSEIIKARLIFENVIQHPTVMLKKSLISKKGYPTEYPYAEDYCLWTELAEKTDFAILPKILLRYRLHRKQVGQEKSDQQHISVAKIHKKLLEKIGINCSNEELELHEKLCTGTYDFTKGFMNRVDKWFAKILNSNNRKKLFEEKALKVVLSSRWLSICLMHTRLKRWIWHRYWRSKFAKLDEKARIRQLWWESNFIPFLRPLIISAKKHPIVKRVLLG